MDNDYARDERKQEALSRILGVASNYGKVILVGSALAGAVSLFPGVQIPPELAGIVGGIGVEALGSLIDRLADADDFTDEEIIKELDQIQADIDRLLTRDYFDHVVTYLVQWQKRHDVKNDEIINLVSHLQNEIDELRQEKQQAQQILKQKDANIAALPDETRLIHTADTTVSQDERRAPQTKKPNKVT